MPRTDKLAASAPPSLLAKLIEFGWFAVSTLLMIEMREACDAATGGDKSDAKYRQGM